MIITVKHPTLQRDIENKTARISVFGLGFIGLPTALSFAYAGYRVNGIDINPIVVTNLNTGIVHIAEKGLEELLQSALTGHYFCATTDFVVSEIYIIAIATPLTKEKSANLVSVEAALTQIANKLRPGNLVIIESTLPPGTTENIISRYLNEISGLSDKGDYFLAYCPERAMPGKLLDEIRCNARIIGGTTPEATDLVLQLYRSFVSGAIFPTSATVAELVKLLENTYRDVNIALANEISVVCDGLGVNASEVISLANHHPRVHIHQPGIGVGGDCIPVSPQFIIQSDPLHTGLIQYARAFNARMPIVTADRIEREFIQKQYLRETATIGVIGMTYRANIPDFRNSPAIEVIKELANRGYTVHAYDPFSAQLREPLPENIRLVTREMAEQCDYVVELVHHDG